MKPTSTFVAVLLVFLVASTTCESFNGFDEALERDSRAAGSGQTSDIIISPGSGTLDDALAGIVSDTDIILMPGKYNVTNFMPVTGVRNVGIIGRGNVTITCSSNVGLVFINVTELTIEGVRIERCGLTGPNLEQSLVLLRQFIDLFYVVYPEMRFALLIGHCEDLRIQNVDVVNNVGFGLVGVNVIGSSLVRQLTAVNNTQPSDCRVIISSELLRDPSRYGGGAVFLYQDYLTDYQPLYNDQLFDLNIDEGLFTKNSECSFNYLSAIRFGDPSYIYNLGHRIGGGGGLALLLGQYFYGVSIKTSNSHFEDNRGTLGASAHLSLFPGVKDTSVIFDNCTFTRNGGLDLLQSSSLLLAAGGLGVVTDLFRVEQDQYSPPHIVHNLNTSLRVKDSSFTYNTASFGAGVYFYSGYRAAVSDLTDVLYVYFENCLFTNNQAFIGSALQLFEYKYSSANVGTQIVISDSTITNNTIVTADPNGTQSILQSSGVIDVHNLNVTLAGNCSITLNRGTALRADMSYVGIQGNITFAFNIGILGGALHLVSYTTMIVVPGSSLYLIGNVARQSGGAIYSNYLGSNSYVTGGNADCFLTFSYDTVGFCVNCSDLNSTGVYIKFENNVAQSGSQIFGSSLQSCPWAIDLLLDLKQTGSVLQIVSEIFPNIFDFDHPPVGPRFVKTQSSRLNIIDSNRTSAYDPDKNAFNIIPGEVFNLTFVAVDDFNQIVSNVVSSFVSSDIPLLLDANRSATPFIATTSNFGLLQDDTPTRLPVSVLGTQGQNLTVVIYSTDSGGRAQTQIDINLGYCGDGFEFNTSTLRCICDRNLERLGIMCDITNLVLLTRNGLWVGPVDSSGTLGVTDCLFCEFGMSEIPVRNGRADFDVQCSARLNRAGVLCGECREGYSLVIGTNRCLKCTNVYILLFPVFLLLGIFMVFVIFFLDITITGGLINGAIFYSNLVSLYGTFLFPSSVRGGFFLVSFLSLNFGIETCLYERLGALDRLWWQLSFPFYLFILMGIIVLLARTKYYQIISKSNRSSAVRAFATLLLLCYVSVLQATVQLLGFVRIPTEDGGSVLRWVIDPSIPYFQGGHAALAFLAILLILFYIIPFPIFMLFPSLLYRSRYLSKYKPIYDAFWVPFETNCRVWLGFRLIFRWIPFALSFLVQSPINLFVTDVLLIFLMFVQLSLKPFRNKWKNLLDSFFILVLVVMFIGSLFFAAEGDTDDNEIRVFFDNAGTTYNRVFVVIAFTVIISVFVYHTVIRFPKLKVFVLRVWAKIRGKEPPRQLYKPTPDASKVPKPEQGEEVNESINMIQSLSTTQQSNPYPVTSCELREPLLEDSGFATVISLPSKKTGDTDSKFHTS